MADGADRMKVSVFTTMPPGVYSGGRYLSLILAYAMARAGAEVAYVTNNAPLFERDFAPYDRICPIRSIVAPTFALPADLASDWVVVIPTGGFNNRFYNAAIDHARAQNARLALLSFETPNWFAEMSPWPRSAMPTESWRQVVAGGGLIVSIAEEGVAPARAYFGEGTARAPRRFGHWHPAINDLAAEVAQQTGRERRSITMFVRTEDPHKGAHELLRLPPEVLEGHVLSLVFGRGVDEGFVTALRRHLAPARDVAVEVLSQITDVEKFALLSRTRLLLFPSWFEGYGYPPVEAAWMGVPSVAWDLPLLREVAGDAVTRVTPGDIGAFAAAIRHTLATRPPGPEVRAMMRSQTDTLSAGQKMLDLLRRAAAVLPPVMAQPASVPVADGGTGLGARAVQLVSHHAGPAHLYEVSASLQGGRVRFAARLEGARKGDQLRIALPGGTMPPVALEAGGPDRVRRIQCEGELDVWPAGADRLTLRLTLVHADRKTTDLGRVDLLPDWMALLAPAANGSLRRPQDCVVVADPGQIAARPLLAAALCELCAALQHGGHRVALVMPQGVAPPAETAVPDLLPVFDAVEVAGPAPEALRALRGAAAGGLVATTRDICAAAGGDPDAGLVLDPGGTAADEVVIFLPGGAPAGGRRALRPDALRWGRTGRGAAAAPLVVVVPAAPLDALDGEVRRHLKQLERRLPGLQLMIPAPLCGPCAPLAGGLNTLLVPSSLAQIAVRLAAGGRILGLRIGQDDGRSHEALLAEALLAAYRVPLASPGDDDPLLAGAEALAAGGLADLVTAALPAPAGHHLAQVAPEVAGAILRSALARTDRAVPQLARGGVLSFSATLDADSPALAAGWADRTTLGARIARDSAAVVFGLQAPQAACNRLELMLHLSPAPDPGLAVKIVLNGHLLGTLTRLPAGASAHALAVPEHAWAEGEQVLFVALVRGEASAASKITLIALSPTATALPPVAGRPAADTGAGARLAPVYAAPIEETAGVVGCRFAKGSPPGFMWLVAGWSVAETGFTWSSGPQAVLGFQPPLVSAAPLLLTLHGSTLNAPDGSGRTGQRMIVRHGTRILSEVWLPAPQAAALAIPLPPLPAGTGLDMIFLDFPDARQPAALGLGEDTRHLGLALQEAECRILPLCTGRGVMQADADAAWPVMSLEIAAGPGILRLAGQGPVPAGLRFGLAGSLQTVWPVPAPEGGWIAGLPLSADDVMSGPIRILCLSADACLPAGPVACEIWTDPPHRRADAAGDLDGGARMVQVAMVAVHDGDPAGEAALARLEAVDLLAPPEARLALPAAFEFRDGSAHLDLLGGGWSTPEQGWVWSEGAEARIDLPAPVGAAILRFELGALVFDGVPCQRAVLMTGGTAFATLRLAASEARALAVALPPWQAPSDSLVLALPDATTLAAAGLSADARMLAVRLYRLHIDAIPPSILPAAHAGEGGAGEGGAGEAGPRLLQAMRQPDGGWLLQLGGSGAAVPFGLAVVSGAGGASVIMHTIPVAEGWRVFLALQAGDITDDGQVAVAVYATAAEAGQGLPAARLSLPLPTLADG